jgi:hypothetical protein
VAGLEQKIYGLPELLQRNKEIIVEVGGALDHVMWAWFVVDYMFDR